MQTNSQPSIVYRFKDGLYINLTNRCPNLCVFCIKTKWNMQFDGNNLNLQGKEPSAAEVLNLLKKEMETSPVQEVVFCGYGEPTMRLAQLLEIAHTLKGWVSAGKFAPFKIRLNTNGLGNLINKQNIVPLLREVIDTIYISLNAQNEAVWRQIVAPAPGFEAGFSSVLEFIRLCAGAGFDKVVASCVDQTGADPKQVAALAKDCGAEFYLRSFLDAKN